MVAEKGMSRRSFVDWLLGIGVVGSSISFLYPVLKFVIPPAIAEAIELSVMAGNVGELPPNSGKVFKFGRRPALLINTPSGETPRADEVKIRTTAVYTRTPIMTALSGARAAALGIAALKKNGYAVKALQEYH